MHILKIEAQKFWDEKMATYKYYFWKNIIEKIFLKNIFEKKLSHPFDIFF